ncbi:MAG: SdpI family protein [Acidobacteriota bacterium]
MDSQTPGVVTILLLSAVFFLLGLPLARGKVRPNGFYGFRTRTTLGSEEAWYTVNAFYGRCLLAASLATAVGVLGLFPYLKTSTQAQVHWTVALLVVPQTAAIVAGLVYQRRFRRGS